MPVSLGAAILIALGAGVLAVAYQGQRRGVLPAGLNFHRAYQPDRTNNAFSFHFFLALYYCGGFALVVWGLLMLLGMAPPLRQWLLGRLERGNSTSHTAGITRALLPEADLVRWHGAGLRRNRLPGSRRPIELTSRVAPAYTSPCSYSPVRAGQARGNPQQVVLTKRE